MAQAETLASGLDLSAADHLLDIGTGRGWPGLYAAPGAELGRPSRSAGRVDGLDPNDPS
jgi:16S rRNA G527 N7-methylase RsmG